MKDTAMEKDYSTPQNTVDIQSAAAFLTLARPEGLVTLVAIVPDGKVTGKTFNMPGEADAAAFWAGQQNNKKMNVYWMPSIPSRKLNKKPAKSDVASMPFAWVDLDLDEDIIKECDYAAAWVALQDPVSQYPKPTFMVCSGNGYNLLYRLSEPMTDQAQFEIACKGLHGEHGDSTFNCDRILRLPFSKNYPNKAKLRKGYPESPGWAYVEGAA